MPLSWILVSLQSYCLPDLLREQLASEVIPFCYSAGYCWALLDLAAASLLYCWRARMLCDDNTPGYSEKAGPEPCNVCKAGAWVAVQGGPQQTWVCW